MKFILIHRTPKIMLKSFILTVLALPFFGCRLNSYGLNEFLYRPSGVKERTKKIEKLTGTDVPLVPPATPGVFTVLVITDVHFGAEKLPKNGPRFDDDFFDWLGNFITANPTQKPAFCVGLGDMAEHGWEEEFKQYKKFTDRLETDYNIKTYNAVGNHDLYNSGWQHYKKYLYPYKSLYYFEAGNFSWYFIDTASGSLGAGQMRLLNKTMQSDPNPKIVMTHFPLWANGHFYFSLQDSLERNLLISTFAKNNVKAVLTGHTHKKTVSDFGKFMEYNYPGFFARAGWGLITVNTNTGEVSSETYYLPVSRALSIRFPNRELCNGEQCSAAPVQN